MPIACRCALAVLLLTAGGATAAEDSLAREYKDAQGKVLAYRLVPPDGYVATQKYPLVLFLHGAGERGQDNLRQLSAVWDGKDRANKSKPFSVPDNRAKFPCFLVAPQVPGSQQWVNVPWSNGSYKQPEISDCLRMALELVEALPKELSIDTSRLYIIGLSMGGYGTWDAITRRPDLFAAAIACCGAGDLSKAPLIAKLPIWAFHGDKDNVVPVSGSREMVAALKAAGGSPKYIEYPGQGHASWPSAFAEPELLPWLFAQKRAAARGAR